VKTFSEYKQLLSTKYNSNEVLQDSIKSIIDKHYNK